MRSTILWLTGLSGSGKTTLALQLRLRMTDVETIDGDRLRRRLPALGFNKSSRLRQAEAAMILAACSPCCLAIVSLISPYRSSRALARQWAKRANKDFYLVHIKCPLEVCEQRDVKGLYARARAGEIEKFTGINHPYEEPDDADLVLRTDKENVQESASKLYDFLLEKHKY